MKVLKFNKHYPPYKPGDVAGFPAKEAAAILKAKVAVRYSGKSVDKPKVDKAVKSPAAKK